MSGPVTPIRMFSVADMTRCMMAQQATVLPLIRSIETLLTLGGERISKDAATEAAKRIAATRAAFWPENPK